MKKTFLLFLFISSKTYSMEFDNFKNDLLAENKNAIASSCILQAFENKEKIVDTTIHLAKGQHIKSVENILNVSIIPLCIPIKYNSRFLNFVRDFYLLFDTSDARKGAVTKLRALPDSNIEDIKGIDVILGAVSKTFSYDLQFLKDADIKNCTHVIDEIRNAIRVSKCIPTSIKELDYIQQRLETANRADIPNENEYLINVKSIDTSGEKTDVLQRFIELRKEIHREIIEKTNTVPDILEKIKAELDKIIRADLLTHVVPCIRLAAELFVNNKTEEVSISSEDMTSVFDDTRGKPQIVSTRGYVPLSFKSYIIACISSEVSRPPPTYDVLIKAVLSKELGLLYLSTFFSELRRK